MMTAINNIVNKQEIETDHIKMIQALIKPFSEHTALSEKVSELRKENMNSKNEIRQAATKVLNLEATI